MDLIKSYLDRFFEAYPDTIKRRNVRDHILSMMNKRYSELIEQEKTHHEALSILFQEYKDIEPLAAEFNLHLPGSEKYPPLTSNEASEYLSQARTFGKKTNLLVMLVLIASIHIMMLGCLSEWDYTDQGIAVTFVVLIFLIPSVIYTVLYFRLFEAYRLWDNQEVFIEDTQMQFVFEQEHLHFERKNKLKKRIGIFLLTISLFVNLFYQLYRFSEYNDIFNIPFNWTSITTLLVIMVSFWLIIPNTFEDYAYRRLLGSPQNMALRQKLVIGGILSAIGVIIFSITILVAISRFSDVFPWLILVYLFLLIARLAPKNTNSKDLEDDVRTDSHETNAELDQIEYISTKDNK